MAHTAEIRAPMEAVFSEYMLRYIVSRLLAKAVDLAYSLKLSSFSTVYCLRFLAFKIRTVPLLSGYREKMMNYSSGKPENNKQIFFS